MRAALVATVLCLSAGSVLAQTREAGPSSPHPTWGPGDQAGASNWITPEKVLEAVREGRASADSRLCESDFFPQAAWSSAREVTSRSILPESDSSATVRS